MLGLRCCVGFSLAVASGVCSLVAGLGLLLAVAALIMEHQLWGVWASVLAASGLRSHGSQTLGHSRNSGAHGLGCSAARGIFLDQGVNRVSWHRQADSLPLSHQGSPWTLFLQSTGSTVQPACSVHTARALGLGRTGFERKRSPLCPIPPLPRASSPNAHFLKTLP